MAVDRRRFLKIAGLTAACAACKPCVDAVCGSGAARAAASPSEKRAPAEGKRWAMVIDLKACKADEGCTKCFEACHFVHNVPRFEDKKREVKWIWTEPFDHVFPDQHHEYFGDEMKKCPVMVLCNHCDNPPCVRVCPTKATFRRADGIVMMDYHRCIGCRYCVAACPYGSRSFNWSDPRPQIEKLNPEFPTRTKGVVEKCNFCAERLVRGMQPACVEACTEKGMFFGDLNDPGSEIRAILKQRFTIRRKPELGTQPEIFYMV